MDGQILTDSSKGQTAEEIKKSFDEAQQWAASVGYIESDVDDIIKTARKNKRK